MSDYTDDDEEMMDIPPSLRPYTTCALEQTACHEEQPPCRKRRRSVWEVDGNSCHDEIVRYVQSQMNYKKHNRPRIPSAVAHNFLGFMWVNVINSGDFNQLMRFFRRYTTPDIRVDVCDEAPTERFFGTVGIHSIIGREMLALYMGLYVLTSPDFASRITRCSLISGDRCNSEQVGCHIEGTYGGNAVGCIEMSVNVKGTRLFDSKHCELQSVLNYYSNHPLAEQSRYWNTKRIVEYYQGPLITPPVSYDFNSTVRLYINAEQQQIEQIIFNRRSFNT